MNAEWLAELSRLTPAELLDVKARVNALLSLQSLSSQPPQMPMGTNATDVTERTNDNRPSLGAGNASMNAQNDPDACITADARISCLHADAVLTVVGDTLNRLGIAVERSLRGFRRSNDFGSWQRDILPALNDYFENANIRQRNVKIALLSLGIELLISQFQVWDVPVSPRAVCLGLLRIPALIDRHYPGYAISGLLHLIVAR